MQAPNLLEKDDIENGFKLLDRMGDNVLNHKYWMEDVKVDTRTVKVDGKDNTWTLEFWRRFDKWYHLALCIDPDGKRRYYLNGSSYER